MLLHDALVKENKAKKKKYDSIGIWFKNQKVYLFSTSMLIQFSSQLTLTEIVEYH